MIRCSINGIYIGIPNYDIYTNALYDGREIKNYYVGDNIVHVYNTIVDGNTDYTTITSLTLKPLSDASFIEASELKKHTEDALGKYEHGLRLNKY